MRRCWPVLLLLACWSSVAAAIENPPAVDYARDVKPLLARHCQTCHGALRQESGLRLDSAARIRLGGDSGPAIVPGRSGESLLIQAVTRAENRMPAEGEPLDAAQIALLTRWIDSGAAAPEEPAPPDPRKHWAFQQPLRPELPRSGSSAGLTSPIDALLARAREERGLAANPPADRGVQLRRVYLDLVGLPPGRDELHAFLADETPEAYERVVDRLLASPQYGQRWARHWMDVWRYADWAGYGKEVRDSQQHIWHWRDWIVESLNADRGYDQMIIDMLAGDELAPENAETLRATGYLARNWYRFNRNVWLDNTVEHTGKAFLGLTLNCARCHDHMYDPIAQQDYYRFRAFFEPYDVRIDRLPGEPNVEADGIARVYDAHQDRPTYLFARGQESQPKEDEALAPGVPAALGGGKLAIEPVALPPAAYNTALKPFVRERLLAEARSAVEKATANLSALQAKLAESHERLAKIDVTQIADPGAADRFAAAKRAAEAAVTDKPAAVIALEKQLASATAALASVETRIAADNARYASPPAANAAERIAQAVAAANQAALCAAEVELLAAEQKVAGLPSADSAEQKVKDERAKAEKVVADARQKLETVRAEAEKRTDYPPLDKIYPATSTGRRLALARWIAGRSNPLVARVAVNHMWMRHFGEPLVATVFDFGMNGKPPVHAELLDWLAVEFMDRGFSMKAMHRLIVTSQAYRMRSTSGADDSRRRVDPDNRYLWRANPRRMEAEAVRDSLLFVAGQLDLAAGGPDIEYAKGLVVPRRSLYFQHANDKQMTFLKLFDAASVNECYRRNESVVPQQALALANSPLALEQSRRLAGKLWQEASAAADGAGERFVRSAFEQILCRGPSEEELAMSTQFLVTQAVRLAGVRRLTAFTGEEAAAVKPAEDAAMRAREDLVHVLVNHNDFVTIR
jgi:hypothetical protein